MNNKIPRILLGIALWSNSLYGGNYHIKQESWLTSLRPIVGVSCFAYSMGSAAKMLIDSWSGNNSQLSMDLFSGTTTLIAGLGLLRIKDIRYIQKIPLKNHYWMLSLLVSIGFYAESKYSTSYHLNKIALFFGGFSFYSIYRLFRSKRGVCFFWDQLKWGHDWFDQRSDIKNKAKLQKLIQKKTSNYPTLSIEGHWVTGEMNPKHSPFMIRFLTEEARFPAEIIEAIFSYCGYWQELEFPVLFKELALKYSTEEARNFYWNKFYEGHTWGSLKRAEEIRRELKECVRLLIMPWLPERNSIVNHKSLSRINSYREMNKCENRTEYDRSAFYRWVKQYVNPLRKQNIYNVSIEYEKFEERLKKIKEDRKECGSLLSYCAVKWLGWKSSDIKILEEMGDKAKKAKKKIVKGDALLFLPLTRYCDKYLYNVIIDIYE